MRKTRSLRRAFLLASGCVIALTAVGVAQDKLAQVKARQDFMERQQKDVDAINDYAKGKGEKAVALEKADDLIALAPKIVDLFPPGTSSKDFPGKSKAKPEIWAEWDKAKLIPEKLRVAELKLADVIKTGTPQQVGEEMRAVYRNNCNSCHGPYREPEH